LACWRRPSSLRILSFSHWYPWEKGTAPGEGQSPGFPNAEPALQTLAEGQTQVDGGRARLCPNGHSLSEG
jgi:hypothetical protein